MTVVNDTDAAKYYNKQPKKRIGAGVLIFNKRGELLIVKPNYLEKWLWIGGGVEESEAPQAAATRECQEEIGVVPPALWLAFVNYLPLQPTGQTDMLQFLFTTDPVEDDFIEKLHLQDNEIDDARFVPVSDLMDYLHDYRARAVQTYFSNKQGARPIYLEDGQLA